MGINKYIGPYRKFDEWVKKWKQTLEKDTNSDEEMAHRKSVFRRASESADQRVQVWWAPVCHRIGKLQKARQDISASKISIFFYFLQCVPILRTINGYSRLLFFELFNFYRILFFFFSFWPFKIPKITQKDFSLISTFTLKFKITKI